MAHAQTQTPEVIQIRRGRINYEVFVRSRTDKHVIWLVQIPRSLSAKPTCGCKGYEARGECAHGRAALEALLATEPQRVAQRRIPAKAVVADPDPFTELFTASPVEVMA